MSEFCVSVPKVRHKCLCVRVHVRPCVCVGHCFPRRLHYTELCDTVTDPVCLTLCCSAGLGSMDYSAALTLKGPILPQGMSVISHCKPFQNLP